MYPVSALSEGCFKCGPNRLKRALVAPDKFRGTASARQVCSAIAAALERAGYQVCQLPMSDGGEGLMDVFEGVTRESRVSGPDGVARAAAYKIAGDTAIIEMAKAAGLGLIGGPDKNDPVSATTKGVGELIRDAVFSGVNRVIVGCGGSATTDGGLGAIEALEPVARLRGTELVIAVDVATLFKEAAREFAAQKGASPAQVELLSRRLELLQARYLERFGVDVSDLTGGGAAGGLAGGLAAIGGEIMSGFDLVAEVSGFFELVDTVDLVVTGEGLLDRHSYEGKVVGGVTHAAASKGVPCLVIAGDREEGTHSVNGEMIATLVGEVGAQRAFDDTVAAITQTAETSIKFFDLGL